MAASNKKVESFLNQVNELRNLYFLELDNIVINSRWLVTLVLAEISGIAYYRKLINAESLSIPFSIIIIFLIMTICVFMISILASRIAKKKISLIVNRKINHMREISCDGDIAPNAGDEKITDNESSLRDTISKIPSLTRSFEYTGITLFIFSSISTILVLFFNETFKFLGF